MTISSIELDLTPDECNLVLAALGELPYKISAPLIIKIKQQGDAQMIEASDNVASIKEVANG